MPMDVIRNNWFSEIAELWPGQCFSLKVKKILHEEKSDYQDIKILETYVFGIYLLRQFFILVLAFSIKINKKKYFLI